jgi:hypothetical protein
MAINIQKLVSRLREFEDGQKTSEFSKLLWKPKEGPPQKIRIVPYKFNSESPFIELQFYYNLGKPGNHYLAPCTFGKQDPIQEVIEALRSSGSNEEKETAKKLSPTTRTYVPIIVRGEEELGVRYWGFGTTVYKQLLTLMTNPDSGDITSFTDGNDLTVTFSQTSGKKDKKTGKSFPETIVTPSLNKTPVVDPTRRDLMEKVKEQTDILKIFPLKTYDELKEIVENWLNPENNTSEESPDKAKETTSEPTKDVKPEVATSSAATPTSSNLSAEFESFFKK